MNRGVSLMISSVSNFDVHVSWPQCVISFSKWFDAGKWRRRLMTHFIHVCGCNRFVAFADYASKPPNSLAEDTLRESPQQFVDCMLSKGLRPKPPIPATAPYPTGPPA